LINSLLGNLLLDDNVPADATVSGSGFGFITFDNAKKTGAFTGEQLTSVVDKSLQ
jgi:hypothetical protein